MKLEGFVAQSIDEIDPAQWDACAGDSPVVRHAFFRALEQSGSLGPQRGVLPRYIGLREPGGPDGSDRVRGRLVACAPAMWKWGNKREFGPEIRWLKAGIEAGCFAWPKFQVSSPFYPMMGPKLLVHPSLPAAPMRAALLKLLVQLGRREDGHSAFSLMHITAEVARECAAMGALISHEVRSAWHNPGYASFADYVQQLPHRKRHHLLKERRKVAALGLSYRLFRGSDITAPLLADFYEGFSRVCARYGGRPWLPMTMLAQLCQQMPEAVCILAAFEGERYVAGVFWLQDSTTLYGDIWSALQERTGLCFELVCYRQMEYAVEQGLRCVDAGPVGPHKTLRGYTPEAVYHAHWFYNEELEALARKQLSC